jgi:hypothetical protein
VLNALDHRLRERDFAGICFAGNAAGCFLGDIHGNSAAIFQDNGIGVRAIHRAGQSEAQRENRHV